MDRSFLTDRLQCVVSEYCYSDWSSVLSGVPQGSVLGPILFIVYIGNVGEICSDNVTHCLYADDLKLYSTIKSDRDNVFLQTALDRLEMWCREWQLSININKCHVLHIGRKKNKLPNWNLN